jgi:hypothetical protein
MITVDISILKCKRDRVVNDFHYSFQTVTAFWLEHSKLITERSTVQIFIKITVKVNSCENRFSSYFIFTRDDMVHT